MKYLITGGAGFLGSNLANHVLEEGKELIVFDNLSRIGSTNNLDWLKQKGELNFIHADIRNYNDVENCIKQIKPDIIFHLAGQVTMTNSIKNPRLDFEVNALGTHNLLEAVRKYSPESIILYSSTNKVYGDIEYLNYEETETRYVCKEYPNGFNESLKLDFHSPYGCSKGAADQYMLDYHRIYGLKTVVLRHSSMFGYRQFATYDQGWIGWFCKKATETQKGILKDPFTISGNGKQVRDVLFIDDMVILYQKIVENYNNNVSNVFNIGGGIHNSLSLLELFEILEDILNVKLTYKKIPLRKSDQKFFIADIAKIKELIQWKPNIDKLTGIKKMIQWVKK